METLTSIAKQIGSSLIQSAGQRSPAIQRINQIMNSSKRISQLAQAIGE